MQRLLVSATLRRAGQGYIGRSLTGPSTRFCCSTTPSQQWKNKEEPKTKDIVERLLHDHVQLEAHMHALKDRTQDRDAILRSFAELLIAHSDAEEHTVYPRLRQAAEASGEKRREKKENAEREHTEALVHLLALMEIPTSNYELWEKKLHFLVAGVYSHIEDEETTLINVARQDLTPQQREQIGDEFAKMRAEKLRSDCGTVKNVKKLVEDRASMVMKIKEKVVG
jgi:hemerythrin-like domain-containing protein